MFHTLRLCKVWGLLVVGMLLFTRGFLLSRIHVPKFSEAWKLSMKVSPMDGQTTTQASPSFSKALVLVVDALRLDFLHARKYSIPGGVHVESMQGVLKAATVLENSSILVGFRADPPTTTVQRVKALLSGSLPTFMDVGTVFAGARIEEDNVFYQAMRTGMRVAAIGDDTWEQLFPKQSPIALNISRPFPSLNVKDLHTVDDGVAQVLRQELIHSTDWDILIAHYLGVDHAGHTFSAHSPEMLAKVQQTDTELVEVLELMIQHARPGGVHEGTLMLIIGDHGQTLSGDHGGGSLEEVETALFAVNLAAAAAKLGAQKLTDVSSVMEAHAFMRLLTANGTDSVEIETIEQMDFSASLSAMLGLPTPFENVGMKAVLGLRAP